MLSYLYIPSGKYLTYDEVQGIKSVPCECGKENKLGELKAGVDLKIILYIVVGILILKLFKII